MARPYSDKFLIGLQVADDTRVGIQLAKVCVKANIPLLYIASYFNVTRMAVHGWFRGTYIQERNLMRVLNLIEEINIDLDKGILPAPSAKKAKAYLSKEV
tara:strand:- start:582 stop:881 length:300 start_codon:yes stop_codon:yes gene_type:complete